MLLGVIFMLLGVLGGVAIITYVIVEEKKRKRELEKRKKRAKLKKQKMQQKKTKTQKIGIEDDVKIYIPNRRIG